MRRYAALHTQSAVRSILQADHSQVQQEKNNIRPCHQCPSCEGRVEKQCEEVRIQCGCYTIQHETDKQVTKCVELSRDGTEDDHDDGGDKDDSREFVQEMSEPERYR